MANYLNDEEEFELMYEDEMELLRDVEHEDEIIKLPLGNPKTINFDEPSTSNATTTNELPSQTAIDNDATQSQLAGESSAGRKRTIEELFGDIDDLLFESVVDNVAKKHKGDERAEQLAIIDRIVELREIAKQQKNITTLRRDFTEFNNERDSWNLSYSIPRYPFMPVTRHDSERVYVRFHSEDYEKEETERIIEGCSFSGGLSANFQDTWGEARAILEKAKAPVEVEEIEAVEASEQTKLWVDLYKPRKYLELLSDEGTNRTLLRWLKLWDKAVFNRRVKIKPVEANDLNKKKFFKQQELSTNLDEHGRPEYKVALLCGPPGLGKTTLAHLVAKHAGYNPMEVNASDDRSIEAFKTSLANATQNRSIEIFRTESDKLHKNNGTFVEGRPSCLIFDEIDGAPQTSIDYLIRFINGTVSLPKSKKGGAKQKILKRPIICICNDVYVAALRPLRQIAFIVNFPQTSSVRLSQRLMEIARREHLKTDTGAMMALAEKTNNDVRSCLGVLHFYKGQKKAVTLSDIHRASVGQKDMQKGLFAVWDEIFQVKRSKIKDVPVTTKQRMEKVLSTVVSFGDYERLMQGVYENFPLLKLKDATLSGISETLDWFCFNDLVNKQILTLQNYSLSTYLQFAFAVWHFHFATGFRQKLNYPREGYEMRVKQARQTATISEVLRGMQPQIRVYSQRTSLLLDLLPLLTRIITPSFRPVNLHLYTKDEKHALLQVVNIMIDYNLNYVNERSLDGTFSYKLEPNVEEIVRFDNEEIKKTKPLPNIIKQLIAREIGTEKMRKFEQVLSAEEKLAKAQVKKTAIPNHLQRLHVKDVTKIQPIVTKDIFGRVIKNRVSTKEKVGPQCHNDIWFQYKEGYSNAVKKKIKMCALK